MTDAADTPGLPIPRSGGNSATPFPAKRRNHPAWLERPEIWWVLGVLGVVVLAGGGSPMWARGIVMLAIGGWLIFQPPKETPSRLFEIALLFFLLIGLASSFLPAAWLGTMPWRGGLANMGAVLPVTNATSPWLAGEALAQMVAGLAWFYLCWNLRLDHDSRKRALWSLAGLAAILSAGAAVGNWLKVKYPLGVEAMNFSYFPNRNQSALWYCLGGLVAFGLLVDGLHRRRGRLFLAGGLLLPCLLALVMGRSRMALALFALGTMAIVVERRRSNSGAYLLRLVLPLGLLGLGLMLGLSDHDTLNRVPGLGPASGATDFRLSLWQDTISMTKAQPAGVGLGQFAQIFPQFRFYSNTYQSVRHPDSDWMWVLGETGWAGLAAGAWALWALIKVYCGKRWNSSGPYRHLAAICAGMFLLHSLVDVPGHRWGSWMLLAVLVGIAAPDGEDFPAAATWVPRRLWRALGGLFLVLGGFWLATLAGLPVSVETIEQQAQAAADAAMAKKDAALAITAANWGMSVEPMQWRPYFERAGAELTLQDNPSAALNDFRLARFLEPTWARVPFAEGVLWEPTNHSRAFAAWREAARREDATPEGLWRNIYDRMNLWPDGEDYASILSKSRHVYREEFLVKQVSAKRFPAEIADELREDPELSQYTAMERLDLLKRWAIVDGVAALAFLDQHPKLIENAWMIEASAYASTGRAGRALELAREHLAPQPVPEMTYYGPSDIDSVAQDFEGHPDNLKTGATLARLQMQTKDYTGAAVTLRKMAQWPNPPMFVFWTLAEALTQTGHLDEAWTALQPYLDYQKKLPKPVK